MDSPVDVGVQVAAVRGQTLQLDGIQPNSIELARQRPPVKQSRHKLIRRDFHDIHTSVIAASALDGVQGHFDSGGNEAPDRKMLDGFFLLQAGKVEFPEEVTRIAIPNQNLGGIAHEDLPYFTNLKFLDASDNYFAIEKFGHLPALFELRLRYNHISTIRDCSMLKNLEILDLSYNNLTEEAVNALGSIPRLRKLDLSGNQFQTIPANMRKMRKLQELNLSSNLLHLPDMIMRLADMPRLRELDLENNMIKSFPDCSEGHFIHLEWINLARNGIETEYDIGGLISLKRLNHVVLFGNPLTDDDGDPFHETVQIGDRTIRITCGCPEVDKSVSLKDMYQSTAKQGKMGTMKISGRAWKERGNKNMFGSDERRAGQDETAHKSNNEATSDVDVDWQAQYEDRAVLHPPSGIVELSQGRLHAAVVELREMLQNPVNYDPNYFLRHNFAKPSESSKLKAKKRIPFHASKGAKLKRNGKKDRLAEQQSLRNIEETLDNMNRDEYGDGFEEGSGEGGGGQMFATEIGAGPAGTLSYSESTQVMMQVFQPQR